MPEIKPKDGELGSEAAPVDVSKAINNALNNISIASAKVGQSVTYEDNYRVEVGPVVATRRITHELTHINETAADITFSIYEDLWRYSPSGVITDEKHSALPELQFVKNPLISSLIGTSRVDENCDGQDSVDGRGNLYDCVRYFNLISEARRVPPPDAVKVRSRCGGLTDCLMNITYIRYDTVEWRLNAVVSKLTTFAEIAHDLPDIMYEFIQDAQSGDSGWAHSTPPVLSLCYQGGVKQDGTVYTVTQCTRALDFKL